LRLLYYVCRLLLLVFYYPAILFTKKFPKYWDRLRLYRYELQKKCLVGDKEFYKLHNFSNDLNIHFKMFCRIPGKIEDQLIALNKFENHITSIMPKFASPNTVFLDIGANIGFHTFNVLAHNPLVEAYCFEPNPEIKHELDRNVRINNLEDRIFTQSVALSDNEGEFDFFVMPKGEKNRGTSSLIPEAVNSKFEKIRVKAQPFDQFWNHGSTVNKRVSLIKIDTQGNEESVLRGMMKTIETDRPTLFLEFETHLVKDKSKLWELYKTLEKNYKYNFFIIDKSGFGLEAISFETLPLKDYSIDILGLQGA
jgi:FkbM family methyltransferase